MASARTRDDLNRDFRKLDEDPKVSDLESTFQKTRDLAEEAIERVGELEDELGEKQSRIEELEKQIAEAE